MNVYCCLYCGRDTVAKSKICAGCLGNRVEGKQNRAPAPPPDELEDGYGDEDDADSVCRDGVDVIDVNNPAIDKRRNGKRMR